MRGRKNVGVLLLLLFAGALIGGVIGQYLSQFSFLAWMGFGGIGGYKNLFAVNLGPIDFSVIRFGFDFVMRINGGSIIGMIISLIIYLRM